MRFSFANGDPSADSRGVATRYGGSVSLMNLKKILWLRPVVLLALLTLAAPVYAAIPPAENLLHADTFFVLTAPDFAALRYATSRSPKWLLWNDPAMKPFHDKFMAKWREQFIGPLEQDLGVSLADYQDLPQGQLTLAITQNGWDGQDEKQFPGFLLLLDAKEQSGLLKTNLDLLRDKWTAAGKPIRTETIHGLPFSIVPLSSNDIPPTLTTLIPGSQPVQELGRPDAPVRKSEMVFGQYQSLLIVGNSVKAVEPVVARLTGGSNPCLGDNSIFAADKESQFRDHPVFYSWLNARALFAVISQIPAAEPNPSAPSLFPAISPSAVLNAAGLGGVKSISLSCREPYEGTLVTLYLSVPQSARQGIFKMLATRPMDAAPPAFVPADAVSFWRWRLDSQAIWAELQKTLGGISPTTVGTLNGFIDLVNGMAQQKDANFDLRKNLLANLGDDWLSYDKAPVGTSLPELSQSRGIFLFAAANPEQTILALKTAAALIVTQEGAPAPRDFLGHTIHTVVWRPQASPTGGTIQTCLYFAISSGYVAVSADVSMLEEFLRSAGKPPRPLSATPGLADALPSVGGAGNGLFGYEDQRAVMRTVFAGLKLSASGGGSGQSLVPMLPKATTDWIDFSLLPDYETVAKYFYLKIFTGATTPEGITFRGFSPRPPQLN